jgi:hypothetical protein
VVVLYCWGSEEPQLEGRERNIIDNYRTIGAFTSSVRVFRSVFVVASDRSGVRSTSSLRSVGKSCALLSQMHSRWHNLHHPNEHCSSEILIALGPTHSASREHRGCPASYTLMLHHVSERNHFRCAANDGEPVAANIFATRICLNQKASIRFHRP